MAYDGDNIDLLYDDYIDGLWEEYIKQHKENIMNDTQVNTQVVDAQTEAANLAAKKAAQRQRANTPEQEAPKPGTQELP